jgi:6-phosphogluconolactonase (cycloisomerase 2 family)
LDVAGAVVGHVYVNDNTPSNAIAAFARLANGALMPLPGSPYKTGGRGTGASVGAQGALQVAANGRFLLAVNAASNQISVLRIGGDGSLTSVPGSPFSSNGNQPVSIATHGQLVYVANAGAGGSNYTGFSLGDSGALRPIAGSTVALPDGSNPGDIRFDPSGSHLVATRVGTSLIDSFVVARDGRLTPGPSSPLAAQGPGPFGSVFNPAHPSQLFVSVAHGGAGAGTVSAYDLAADGTLAAVPGSPFPDQQTAPCWLSTTPDGQFLFASNTGSDSISIYRVGVDGTLHLVDSVVLRGGPGLGVFDSTVAPGGSILYVVDTAKASVSAAAIDGGALTELSTSPFTLPAGAAPFGIVAI